MKYLIIFQILLLACIHGRSQHVVVAMHTPYDLELYMKTSKEYQSQHNDNSSIVGSPYLTENFESSLVLLNNLWYEGIALRYDIYNDQFEVEFESGKMIIDPIKNNIDTIKYNGEVFVRKVFEPGNTKGLSYLALLGQWNNFGLFKQYKTRLEAATPTDGYNEARPAEYHSTSPGYYIFNNNEIIEIKGSKTIAEVFNIEHKMVKRYLKEKDYKLSNEDDMISVLAYYSTL
ncbi:hypothetical protein ACFLQX_00185 [Bacteroidota bacterium]